MTEARQQQTATADVLKVISRSAFDLQTVLQTLVKFAARLCEADLANIWRPTGTTAFCLVASFGVPGKDNERLKNKKYLESVDLEPGRGSIVGRVLLERRMVQVHDLQADPEYQLSEVIRMGDYRTALGVPLLRQGVPIGVIFLTRCTVRPFTDKQIELVTSFADQAVIAIENVRLFDEVTARTDDLRESLQQQTATADVLKVISRSAFDLDTVMDTLASSARELCGSKTAALYLRDGDMLVGRGTSANELVDEEFMRTNPVPLNDKSHMGRAVLTGAIANIGDFENNPHTKLRKFQQIMGFKSFLAVPLIREGRGVGVFVLTREELGRFSERQVELVQGFADQAVIAIENTRLFNETTRALEQQTATADILKVIAGSPSDVQPVFEAIVESAKRLLSGFSAAVFRFIDHIAYLQAITATNPAADEIMKNSFPRPVADFQSFAMAQGGSIVQIPDTEALSNDIRDIARARGFRSMLIAPLTNRGTPIGMISVTRVQIGAFSVHHEQLLQTFADQAVIAIENTRLFDEVQAKTRDLTEALQQQTATGDVLKVIASSPTDVGPALQAIVESACAFCNAYDAGVLLKIGNDLHFNAHHGPIRTGQQPRPISREWVVGRSVVDKVPVQVSDFQAPQAAEFPEGLRQSREQGHRCTLSVPLLREGEAIGAIALRRREPVAFTGKQVALLQTFADQAVIAIGNVRLFDEVQARTRDLTESLEQQTATSEVLGAISSSLEELSPLFQKILENAIRVCGAKFGTLNLYDGEKFDPVGGYNIPREYEETQLHKPFIAHPEGALGTVVATRRPVHIEDIRAQRPYLEGHPAVVALSNLAGARTLVAVPMLKDDKLVGTIAIFRQEVSPFSEKQITLLSNFASQAVIAIENNRLLKELRESLQQQTATADVLKVISRSTFDLRAVLQTLVESAAKLCDADKATITRQKDGVLFRGEFYGFSDEFMDYVRNVPVVPDRGSATARALLEGVVVHIPDVQADPDYTFNEAQRLGDFRTIIGVPMLREGKAIGVIVMTRSEVRPFTDKQIELAATFADQAAIAIENVRLFDNVETRTRELAASLEDLRAAQDRLVQTEKLASLGQLTAGIAHEIKNPLNFVNNFSALSAELTDELNDLLKRATLTDKMREEVEDLTRLLKENLDKVVQHGKRADAIVKNMLLHSRQGSGEHRPVDVNALVEESLNLAYHGARAEKPDFNITLKRSFDPNAGEIDVFPQEITRVLLNLISNGFYAATKRKAQVDGDGYEPTLAAATKNLGDSVEIRIRDSGSGIPPEVKEKMFNPFFTTKPAGEGTGLGLSLSYDIVVKQHGGSIEVDTRPGEFTEFKVILPRMAATSKAGADK